MVGTYTLSQLILWLHLFFSKDHWNVFKRKGLWDDWSPSHRCLGLNWMAGGVRTPSSWTWVRKGPGNCCWPLAGHPAGSVVSGLECPELIKNARLSAWERDGNRRWSLGPPLGVNKCLMLGFCKCTQGVLTGFLQIKKNQWKNMRKYHPSNVSASKYLCLLDFK